MTIRNVIVACDYAYIEGGAARVAVQTAVELSKRSNLKVYFFAGCGEPCQELVQSSVQVISLGMYDLLGNPSKLDAMKKGIYNRKKVILWRIRPLFIKKLCKNMTESAPKSRHKPE